MATHYTRAMLTGTRDAEGAFQKRYRFRASSDVRAADGLTIPADAWAIDRYLANPVVLLSHDKYGLPIGRATEVVRHEHGIDAEIEFDEADPLALDVMRKLDGGYMSAVSVSFLIDEMAQRSIVKRASLLEISVVSVPSDPTALMYRGVVMDTLTSPDSDWSDRLARLEERLDALEATRTASDDQPAPEATAAPAVDIDLSQFPNLTRSS